MSDRITFVASPHRGGLLMHLRLRRVRRICVAAARDRAIPRHLSSAEGRSTWDGAQGGVLRILRAPPLQRLGCTRRVRTRSTTACSWTSDRNALGLLQRFVRSGHPFRRHTKGARSGFRPRPPGKISADFPTPGPFATTSLWLATARCTSPMRTAASFETQLRNRQARGLGPRSAVFGHRGIAFGTDGNLYVNANAKGSARQGRSEATARRAGLQSQDFARADTRRLTPIAGNAF